MTRKGNFPASQHSDNECGITGCTSFDYKIICLFSGNGKLDNNGFIIDHDKIHKAVLKAKSSGSCEQMQLSIHKRVTTLLKNQTKSLVAYKCTIRPNDETLIPEPKAMLSYIDCEDTSLLALLGVD